MIHEGPATKLWGDFNRSWKVAYYLLDFDHSDVQMVAQNGDYSVTRDLLFAAMNHFSRRSEYRFYCVDATMTSSYSFPGDGKGYLKTDNIVVKGEMARDEFFSQYALGTLKGFFIATQESVKHLRKCNP